VSMSAIALLIVFYENKQINILDYNCNRSKKDAKRIKEFPAYKTYYPSKRTSILAIL